jgi:hypothetical protein
MKKILILICLSILIFSCAAKKETTDKETVYITKTDTVKFEKIVTKTEIVTDTVRVKVPCDEKGNIKDFSRKIKTSNGHALVYSKNGEIFAELYLGSTENSTEAKEKIKTEYIYKDKFKTIYKTLYTERWWLWAWFIGSLIYILWKIYLFFQPKFNFLRKNT